MKRGFSFYAILIILLQIFNVLLVVPDFIPYFDRFVIISINLSYFLISILFIRLSFLTFAFFKDFKIVARTFITCSAVIVFLLGLLVAYSITSLSVGQGTFGPKLVETYEVSGYEKTIYIYRNILLDTSLVVKEGTDNSPFLTDVIKLPHLYGEKIRGFRAPNSVFFKIDSTFLELHLEDGLYHTSEFKELNRYSYQEIYPTK